MMGWILQCYIPSFMEIGPLVLEMKILKDFYHIWAWRQSWSGDQDIANKMSMPLPMEAPHKNFNLIGQAVSEEKIFEIVT